MTGSSFLAGELGEVAAELVEDERTRRRRLRGATTRGCAARFLRPGVAREQLDDLLANAATGRRPASRDLRGDTFALADEAEEDVLGADVVVAELQRLAQGELEDLLRRGVNGM